MDVGQRPLTAVKQIIGIAFDVSAKKQAWLKAEGLGRRYGSTLALDHVSFEVIEGEIFSLLGPSGCGKSTTLRLIAGLEEPDAGEIWLNGELIASPERGILVPAERRNMGLVFQSYAVWPHMTVAENIFYPLEVRRWDKARIKGRTAEILELVGLTGLEQRRPSQLSGGQQQRLALARSLAYELDLLLLDEPLSNVDAKLREQLRFELKRLQQSVGITIVYVTHDQTEAMSMSHRIAIMNHGHIEQIGQPEAIYKNPSSFFVQSFVGRLITFEGTVKQNGPVKEIELACGSSVVLVEPATVPADRKLKIAVRPEDIEIRTTEREPGAGEIPGVVVDVSYIGSRYECAVSAANAEFVLETAPHSKPQRGQRVMLRLNEMKFWPA